MSPKVQLHTAAAYPPAARQAWEQRIDAVRHGGIEAIAETVIQRYLHEDFRREYPLQVAHMRSQLLRCDPAGYAACCHAIADMDWLDELHRIDCPTLVLAGARDVGATPAMARAINDRIRGSQLVVFDDASHLSPVELPRAFVSTLRNFLQWADLTQPDQT